MINLDSMALWDATTPDEKVAEIFRQCPDLALPIPIRDLAFGAGILEILSFDEAFPQLKGRFPADGMIISDEYKESGVIFYKPYVHALGRVNFTIAHELGHHLHQHHSSSQSCSRRDFYKTKGRSQRDIHESEANRFAKKLLLPHHLVAQLLDGKLPSLALFQKVEKLSGASFKLTANTCSSYMAHTPMVLIYSHNGVCINVWANQRGLREFLRIQPQGYLPIASSIVLMGSDPGSLSSAQICKREVWFHSSNEVSLPPYFVEQTLSQLDGYAVTLVYGDEAL